MKRLRRRARTHRPSQGLGALLFAGGAMLFTPHNLHAEPEPFGIPSVDLLAQASAGTSTELRYAVTRGLTRTQELVIEHEGAVLPGSNDAFIQPPYTLRVPLRTHVQSMEEDGGFVLLRSLGTPRLSADRMRHPDDAQRLPEALRQLRIVETLSAQGDIQSTESALSPDGVPTAPIDLVLDLLRMSLPPLPAEALGIGDSWAQVFPMHFSTNSTDRFGQLSVRYTLVGQQTHEGRQHWEVNAEMEATFQGEIAPARRGADRTDISGYMRGTSTHLIDAQTLLPSRIDGRIGTVLMLGTRDANRRRQAYETSWSLR